MIEMYFLVLHPLNYKTKLSSVKPESLEAMCKDFYYTIFNTLYMKFANASPW